MNLVLEVDVLIELLHLRESGYCRGFHEIICQFRQPLIHLNILHFTMICFFRTRLIDSNTDVDEVQLIV